MKIKILFITILTIFFSSCQEKDFELFSDGNEVYFNKFFMDEYYPGTGLADSTVNSYFFYPTGTEDITTELVVCLSGKLLKEDANFNLKVVAEGTTALPEEYTINNNYVFKANNIKDGSRIVTDTISVTFHKSSRLETLEEGIRLVVELVGNDKIKVGQYERSRAILICSTKTTKPDWWDNEVVENLLGKYSQKKYKLFLDNVDRDSKLNAELIFEYPDEAIDLAYKFKAWLNSQETPILEEDGTVMSVPV